MHILYTVCPSVRNDGHFEKLYNLLVSNFGISVKVFKLFRNKTVFKSSRQQYTDCWLFTLPNLWATVYHTWRYNYLFPCWSVISTVCVCSLRGRCNGPYCGNLYQKSWVQTTSPSIKLTLQGCRRRLSVSHYMSHVPILMSVYLFYKPGSVWSMCLVYSQFVCTKM